MTARVATLGAVLASALLVSCPMAERATSGAIRAGSPSPAPGQAVVPPAVPHAARRSREEHPVFVLQPTVQQLGASERGSWPAPTPDELADLGATLPGGAPAAASSAAPAPSVPGGADQLLDQDPRRGMLHAVGPAEGLDPDRVLAATAKETFVYSRPDWKSRRLGYLRAGAVVARGAEPVGHSGCSQGWYAVAPQGYVCVGKMATLDVGDPVVQAEHTRADRHAALPYRYGESRFPTPPLYTRVPTKKQQLDTEPDLARHPDLRARAWKDAPFGPVPAVLADGRPAPTFSGYGRDASVVSTGNALVKSGFAFLDFFEAGGRRWGLTTDLDVMPLDKLRPVEPSSFHGLVLDRTTTLPVVFVRSRGAWLYDGGPDHGLKQARQIAYREALPISGKSARIGGARFLETTSGQWLRDDHLVRVDPMKHRPGWASPGRTWIDVSILKQALIAYEGTTPVYVTLVSTGADGLGDPEETHSTVRGVFLIHTKHISVTMSGDEADDEFDLRDVPYVQYFKDGYALHAAYWHDAFGIPRSHGCVNLAPIDARWLFDWTDPPVPDGWHGAMSLHDGTLVSIHP
jgi:hypothetical protein